MKLKELSTLLHSALPIMGSAIKRGQLFKPHCTLTPPDPDILCEYNVEVPISEGFNVTVSIFRSKKTAQSGEKVPVVMCAHPYDCNKTPALKNTPLGGPPQQYRMIPQCGGTPEFSTLTSWEAPDPNFWVNAGYAVVNMNMPGFATSEGQPTVFSQHQGKCFYEAIEWIAKQPWCTGKVGLTGVSFLAISQYYVAAGGEYDGPPPSLKCISPWEGVSDPYRDVIMNGGIKEIGFPTFWWHTEVKDTINGTEQDFIKSEGGLPLEWTDIYPFMNDHWQAKIPKLEDITLPMLVGASFSDHSLHTMGTCRAFEKAQSKHKWLYTHRTGKWVSYYSQEVMNLTKEFMDCFLKDEDNGFKDKPAVRLEVRESRDTIKEVRHENEWPLARTQYTPMYFLKMQHHKIQNFTYAKSSIKNQHEYKAKKGELKIQHTFSEDTELSGYFKLKLWVETQALDSKKSAEDDMEIFSVLHKLNTRGEVVHFNGSVGLNKDGVSRGCIKVSRRELIENESKPWLPVLSGKSENKLKKGEIVPVEISLNPSSTFFKAGESLQMVISAQEIIPTPPFKKELNCQTGKHIIHFGGEYDSHLLIPIVPR